jgi:hypothetical protein
LQTLRRYALADHVLSTVADPTEDWLLMDEVVLSWIHGTLTAELQDIVRVPDDTAHRIWGALEAQFLGNRQTWILYLETAFRQLAQGDLSVDEYCRQMKTMTDTLHTLGAPITDESLVLNLLRDLSPRFDHVAPILIRMKLFPTFAEAKNDLLLEELRLSATATTAPATAVYTAPRAAPSDSGGGGGFLLTALRLRRPLELHGSLLAPGWGRGVTVARVDVVAVARRAAGWLSGWFSVAILLQPADWHHSYVARTIRGCLGPSPHRLSAGLLFRCTSGGALGSSPASAGASSAPGASGPAHVGALD